MFYNIKNNIGVRIMDKTLEMAQLINSVSYNLDILLSRKLLYENMAITEFKTLLILFNEGDTPIQKMARKVFLTSGSMTYIANKLVNKQFIYKTQSNEDKRVFMLSLTEKGREKIKALILFTEPIIEDYFSGYTKNEKERIIKILRKTKMQ